MCNLIQASVHCYLEAVKCLVSMKYDPQSRDNWVISWASYNGYLKIVKYLVSLGCDPTVHNNEALKMAI